MRKRRDERGNFHPAPVKKQSTPPRCQVCLLCQINPLFCACSWGTIKYSSSYSKNAEVSSSVTFVALLLFPSALRRSVPSDTPHCSNVLQRTFRAEQGEDVDDRTCVSSMEFRLNCAKQRNGAACLTPRSRNMEAPIRKCGISVPPDTRSAKSTRRSGHFISIETYKLNDKVSQSPNVVNKQRDERANKL